MNRGKIKLKSLNDLSHSLLSVFHPLNTTGIVFVMGYVALCVLLGLRLRRDLENGTSKHVLAMHISTLFTCMSVPVTLYQIYDHLSNFFQPRLQIQVIRIILIVPIFALESSLSIHFMEYSFYFQVIREFYESYVIYSFMRFLLYYLGDTEKIVQSLTSKPASLGVHSQPFCCISTWTMGRQFLSGCKTGVLQYVIGRFVLTSLTMLLQVLGMYSEGDYSLDSPHLYFTLLHSLSQTYALYSLFLFYYASAAEFKNIKPFEKFLSIKLIIFFSWWQGILIGFLVSGAEAEHGGVSSHNATRSDVSDGPILSRKINSGMSADQHTTQHMADGVQDLLICMEMLIAAIAFTYSFPVADFKVGSSVASVGGGAGGEEGSDGSEWRDSSGYLPSTLTPSTPGFSGIRRRGIVTPGIGAARGGVSAASLSGLEEGVPRSHDDVGVAEELLLGEQSVEETVMCPAASDTPLLAPEASVHDQSDSMCDESSAASERSRQHSRGEEPLDGRFLLRKSHSTSSLCSSDSNSNLGSARRQSQRSNGKSHHKSSMASPSLDDKRNSKSFLHVARKFNWKDSSDRSLYSHSSLSKKSAFQHGQSDRANGQRSACGKFFSSTLNFLLSCLDTLVVLFSSLLYYCSSLFLEEEDEGGGHSQSDRQKREGSSGPLAVVKHTPTRYYDYHYYHAPPVLDELLQQRGRFTVLQAIYLTLSMGDLRDDMVELLTLTIDSVVIIPSLRFRRWIKSGAQSH